MHKQQTRRSIPNHYPSPFGEGVRGVRPFLFLLFLFFLPLLHSLAQTRGTVVSEQGNPVAFANVVALAPQDSSVVAATLTDEQGQFQFPDTLHASLLRVSALGYAPLYYRSGDADETLRLTLSTLRTSDLGAAEVVGQRPVARIEDGALVTQVEGTILSTRGTAEDVLKDIPGIIARGDQDGTLEVIGRGAPTFYVNGRKVTDLDELKQLTSNEIRQVEVITNPGAAYEANTRAVVRIRTIRRKGEGWGVNAHAFQYQGHRFSSNNALKLSYRKDAFDISLEGGYRRNDAFWRSSDDMYATFNGKDFTMFSAQLGDFSSHSAHGTVELNYSPSDKFSIGARYQLKKGFDVQNLGYLTSNVYTAGVHTDSLHTTISYPTKSDLEHNLNVYAEAQFGKGTLSWDADFYANGSGGEQTSEEVSQNSDNRTIVTASSTRNRLFSTRLSYAFPWLRGKWTFGAQYTMTNRHDNYVPTVEQYGLNISRTLLHENMEAAYAQYSTFIAKKVQLTAGLRYEHVDQNYDSNGVRIKEQSPTYDNLFPSLSLATQLGRWQMMFAYSSSTDRPSYRYLSNNITYANRFLRQTGNPNLKPAIEHSISLTAVYKWLQFSASYAYTKDCSMIYGTPLEGQENVNMLSYINNDLQNIVVTAVAAPSVKWWHPTVILTYMQNISKLDFRGAPHHFNNPMLIAQLRQNFDLPWKLKFALNYRFQSCGTYQNIQMFASQHGLDASLTRSFLGDALTVTIEGNDLLYKTKSASRVYASNFLFVETGQGDTRFACLKLTYKYNARTDKYKGQSSLDATLKRL